MLISNLLGDDSNVNLWDVKTGQLLQNIHSPFNGSVSSITWIRLSQQHDENSSFAYGCIDGTVHVFHRLDQSVSLLPPHCFELPLTLVFNSPRSLSSPPQSFTKCQSTICALTLITIELLQPVMGWFECGIFRG